MPRPFLYTYVPKSAEISTQGLRSISTLNGDEWKKYCGRAGSTKKEDVLKWLEKTIPGRTKGICVFTQPIPDNAPPAILAFRDSHRRVTIKSFDELKKDGIITACYAENLKWEPNTRQLEWIPVDHPDWNEKLTWDGSNPKLLFVKTEHYLIITKDGVIPPKYLTYSRSSNEDYSEEVLAENVIKNGYLYHGSPNRYTVLKPQTQEDVGGKKALSLSPYKFVASMFCTYPEEIMKGYRRCRVRYAEWFDKPKDKYKPLSVLHIYHNIKQVGNFEKIYNGYIYTVDAKEALKDATDNPRWKGKEEVLSYVPEIHPLKIEKHSIKVIAEYNLKKAGIEYDAIPSELSEEALMVHKYTDQDIKDAKVVYRGSPHLEKKLHGNMFASDSSAVYVSPYKGIASMFCISRDTILAAVGKQIGKRIVKSNFTYSNWKKDGSDETLNQIPRKITIGLNVRGFSPIYGEAEGYLYTIDATKYNIKMKPNGKEGIIHGEVEYMKYEPIKFEYVVKPDEENIKENGEASVEEYYYGMNGEEIPNSEDSASLEAFAMDNVSMEDSPVQEAGNYVIIRGFPVAAFFKQLAKHYQTHKLENLIQIVHSIGISQWTVNTRTVKIHHFFLPEIIYLLNKFNMSQTLIGDIQRGSWMGQDPDIKTDCKMSRVEANMNCNLFEHQEKFINDYAELKDSHRLRGYLLSFSQGLGKTVTSVALMEALNKERVIVICPKNTMVETWKAHFERFYKKPQTIYVSGVDKKFEGQRFCIFNYDAIDKLNSLEGLKKPNMGIIVDESHNFLRMQSARTQKLINLARTCENPDVLLMSGTPIKTSGVEMIPLISILDPLFDDEAARIFRESFGVNTKIATEVLHSRLKRMMERVTKEVLDLPPKNKSTIKIKLPDGQKYTIKEVRKGMSAYINDRMKFHRDHMVEYRQEFDECMDYLRTKDIWKTEDFQRYKSILDRLIRDKGKFDQGDEDVAWMNEYEKRFVEPQLPSDLLHKFRHCKAAIKYIQLKVRGEVLGQFIAKLRIEMTTAMLKEANLKQMIDEAKKKTIIFTSYIDTIEACEKYVKGLGYKPIVIYGKNSGDIAPLAAKFQKDPQYNPLIASLQTLSTGATLTAANRVIFLNKPWRSIDYEQASDRVHRIGQDCSVDIISLVLDTGEEGNLSTRMEEIMDESARAFDEIVEERKKQVDAKKASNEVYFDIDDFPADIIDEENLSFEGMTLLNDTKEQRTLNRMAKPHYRLRGANSWEHVQQDMANGILLVKELKHRDLTLQEYATILYHDCGCKSIYPEKDGHGLKGVEIAKPELKKCGFFSDKEIEEICVAILEHDETTNPKNLHSSELSDLLASSDTNPPDIPWILNKSYVWGLRHGETNHDKNMANVVKYMSKIYGSDGEMIYPKLYKEYYKEEIKKMNKFFDNLTVEECAKIVDQYREEHELKHNELTLPEPNTDQKIVEPSVEGMILLNKTKEQQELNKLAKPFYIAKGQNSWEHIQQDMSNGVTMLKKLKHRDITLQEYATILFHDCAYKTHPDGEKHGVYGAEIARPVLEKTGFFSKKEIDEICQAIVEHDFSSNQTQKFSSDLSDFLISADSNPINIPWIMNKCYSWGIRHGKTHEEAVQHVVDFEPTIYSSKGKFVYPKMYKAYYGDKIKEMQKFFDHITYEQADQIITDYRKRHHLSPTETRLPDPSLESLEPSMEAANIKAKRKKVEAYILNAMKLLDPHTDTNVKYWKDKFASMNDKDFDNFMHCLREGKTNIHMFVPPFKVTLQTKEMIEAAHKLGVTIMHRIWMHDPHTGIKYLTPEKYMVLQLPMRRQQQYLDEKLSVPDNDKTIDGLTGQVTGDSKSCAITNPEIQILHARNLDATLYEFANVRGGNIRNYAEFKRSLEETGSVRLEQLDPTNRTRVAIMGQVLLTAMHLDANIAEI